VRSCLIDGEAIVCDANGLAVFDLLRRHWHGDDVILCAFDLLELDGEDLRRAPIEERKAALAKLLRRPPGGIVLTIGAYEGPLKSSMTQADRQQVDNCSEIGADVRRWQRARDSLHSMSDRARGNARDGGGMSPGDSKGDVWPGNDDDLAGRLGSAAKGPIEYAEISQERLMRPFLTSSGVEPQHAIGHRIEAIAAVFAVRRRRLCRCGRKDRKRHHQGEGDARVRSQVITWSMR
jgi:hypothetical protein